jgi:hypothetical protein
VVRRYIDETVSRNHEMLSLLTRPARGVLPHAWPVDEVLRVQTPPDYFLVVDADEIYDADTVPAILEYVQSKQPRGMRVSAYEYGRTWNQRVPADVYLHHQFGFVKAGLLFESRRVVTFNEQRLRKLLQILRLPGGLASSFYGFRDCPREVGMFHHACYVRRGRQGLIDKIRKHSHRAEYMNEAWVEKVLGQAYEYVPTSALPRNIREGRWPAEFFDEPSQPPR